MSLDHELVKARIFRQTMGLRVPEPPAPTYAAQCTPDADKQRGTIETYRARWYVRSGASGRLLQRFGDWGRRWFPFIGFGWDGIGPRPNG